MSIAWKKIRQEIVKNADKETKHARIGGPPLTILMVSGGADSMFMLDFYHNAGINFTVLHFQHGIRDNDHEDRNLIEQYILNKNIQCQFVVGHGENLKDQPNLESAARTQRWDFVKNYVNTLNNDAVVVTAHHLNDNIEQVFLDIMRGSDHSKLGMRKYVHDSSIGCIKYKPFLTIPKATILEKCKSRMIPFIEDITNLDDHHERNWLRNDIIPQLMSRRNLEKSMSNALEGRG